MNLSSERYKQIAECASNCYKYSKEMEALTEQLQEKELQVNEESAKLEELMTVKIAQTGTIPTPTGDVGTYSKKPSILKKCADNVIAEVFDVKPEESKEPEELKEPEEPKEAEKPKEVAEVVLRRFTIKEDHEIVVTKDEVYMKTPSCKVPLDFIKPCEFKDLKYSTCNKVLTGQALLVAKMGDCIFTGKDGKALGYDLIHPYLGQIYSMVNPFTKDNIKSMAIKSLYVPLQQYKAFNGAYSKKDLARTKFLQGSNGIPIYYMSKVAQMLGLLDTLTIYYF